MLRLAFALALATFSAGVIVTAAWVTRPPVEDHAPGEPPFLTTTDTQTLSNKRLILTTPPGDGRGSGMMFAPK
jgi:hypothetical protein